MSTLSQYQFLFKDQIKSEYPKIIGTSKIKTKLKQEHITKVLDNRVRCTGVLKTQSPLFTDSNSFFYYEFLLASDDNISDWKYFYIETSKKELIKEKLPYITVVDFTTGKVIKQYLDENTFTRKFVVNKFIKVRASKTDKHPILKSFSFNGVIHIQNSRIIYEYYNNNELFNSSLINYYSEYYPLNRVIELDLSSNLSIYPPRLNIVPNSLYLDKKARVFEFTGEMNNTFLRHKVLYKYYETIEGRKYINYLPNPPYYQDNSLMKSSININKKIKLSSRDNIQAIKYKQISSSKITINKK